MSPRPRARDRERQSQHEPPPALPQAGAPHWWTLLAQAGQLHLAGEAAALVQLLLGHLVYMEGPPPEPVPGFSTEAETALVKNLKGTPICRAHTWKTEPWQCLLLELPSVPMGRPITLRDAGRTFVPSSSLRFQAKIAAACRALHVALPIGEGAVHALVGRQRTFLAWRSRADNEGFDRALRGDVDNFAKNILDGLQGAGILSNDRGVFRMTASKELPLAWTVPPTPFADLLATEARALREAGQELATIKDALALTHARMTGDGLAEGLLCGPGSGLCLSVGGS